MGRIIAFVCGCALLVGFFLPWIEVTGAPDLEVTRLRKDGRILLFVFQNPTQPGQGPVQVRTGEVAVHLRFRDPVMDLIDERSGLSHGDGDSFSLRLEQSEALFLSIAE